EELRGDSFSWSDYHKTGGSNGMGVFRLDTSDIAKVCSHRRKEDVVFLHPLPSPARRGSPSDPLGLGDPVPLVIYPADVKVRKLDIRCLAGVNTVDRRTDFPQGCSDPSAWQCRIHIRAFPMPLRPGDSAPQTSTLVVSDP